MQTRFLWTLSIIQTSILSDCNGIRTQNHLVRKRTLNHLAKLNSVAVTQTSDIVPVSGKEFRFTLKRARDMIRTYSQMHCTDKYSQHRPII